MSLCLSCDQPQPPTASDNHLRNNFVVHVLNSSYNFLHVRVTFVPFQADSIYQIFVVVLKLF